MLQRTDLQQIKKLAHAFLKFEPVPTGFAAIVKHPFTDSSYVAINYSNKDYRTANILNDNTAKEVWRDSISSLIDNASTPRYIYMALTKSYRFAFLKYAMRYMSRQDFSEYLADAWVLCEAPNSDLNFTQRQMVGLFKRADPRILMSEDDYERLQELDDIVTVYRGVTEYNADRVKALSWTLDQETAEWFAHRFNEDGTVYEAQISREHILAFFDVRNESEVIVDPKYLMNIVEAQEMESGFSITM